MKRKLYTVLFLTFMAFTCGAQEIKSIKIGNQVWMMYNLNINTKDSWNYNDDPKLGSKYGKLYTYQSAEKVCPAGWRLPTIKDWSELLVKLGGEDNASPMMMKNSGEGGFNAKLGGLATIGNFQLLDNYGAYWSASENDPNNAWYIYFTPKSKLVTVSFSNKSHGLSVRCIKTGK